MASCILFDPNEYRELNDQEQDLLRTAYEKAMAALRLNITPDGFTACSLADNRAFGTDANYRAIWTRDGATTTIWTLDLDDADVADCQAATLRTILEHQAPTGQLPAHVRIDDRVAEYGGVGGITSIDSGLWAVIAVWRHATIRQDWSLAEQYAGRLQKTMDWLGAHDSNNESFRHQRKFQKVSNTHKFYQ